MKYHRSFFSVLRPSMIGDIIASLPFLEYLEKLCPNSYKCAYIDKKCSSIIPFLINHPLIDNIKISEKRDEFSENDIKFAKNFNVIFDPYSQHLDNYYYNYVSILEESFRMNRVLNGGYVNPSERNVLVGKEKYPKLYQWFDVEDRKDTIALWCKSGYGNNDPTINLRSPSIDWWEKLVDKIHAKGYKTVCFGHPLSEYPKNSKFLDLPFFDAIKFSLGCRRTISCDSGPAWIIGAYGYPQTVLYTNYLPFHVKNLDATVPFNHNDNLISFFGEKGINNIDLEKVIDNI